MVDDVRRARVGDVNQQVGRRRLFERRSETRDQVVRQVADETDGVAQQNRAPTGKRPAPRPSVERREQHILRENVRIRRRVQERTLSGVRISDQADAAAFAARLDLALFAGMNFLQLPFQFDDFLLRDSFVDFELLFARAAEPDAAPRLPLEVRPHPFQPRERVLELRQFDRQTGFARLRPARENVENQLGSVDRFDFQPLFQIARLARRQVEVEDDDLRVGRLRERFEFVEFSAPQAVRDVRRRSALNQRSDRLDVRRFRQPGQLGERVFSLPLARRVNADENRPFVRDARRSRRLVALRRRVETLGREDASPVKLVEIGVVRPIAAVDAEFRAAVEFVRLARLELVGDVERRLDAATRMSFAPSAATVSAFVRFAAVAKPASAASLLVGVFVSVAISGVFRAFSFLHRRYFNPKTFFNLFKRLFFPPFRGRSFARTPVVRSSRAVRSRYYSRKRAVCQVVATLARGFRRAKVPAVPFAVRRDVPSRLRSAVPLRRAVRQTPPFFSSKVRKKRARKKKSGSTARGKFAFCANAAARGAAIAARRPGEISVLRST